MELHQLNYFAAVARLGNFTRAAAACGVSQPTLSQQVAKLEQELGHQLFERLSRGVRLTAAGTAFRPRAERILALVDDATASVAPDPDAGRLAVAAIPTLAPHALPPPLADFAARFPRARVEVAEATTAELLGLLTRGETDIGLVATPVTEDHLESEPLFREQLLVALPAGHPLASQAKLSLKEVAAGPFVLLHDAHCLAGQTLGFCANRGITPLVTARIQQLETVLELVRLGHGLSLVPESAALPRPGLVFRPLKGDAPTRTVAMAWARTRYRGRLFDAFLDALRRAHRRPGRR